MTAWIQRHPVGSYFGMAFAISWVGSFLVAGPKFLRGEVIELSDAGLIFLTMLAGPSLAGVTLTGVVDGRRGLRDLFSRMSRWRVGAGWYAAALLIPPVLILAVLVALTTLASPDFAPSSLALGLLGGLLAGFFEEIGWMGFAFPRMQRKHGVLAAGVWLGLLHGTWHLVADYLGASDTHGVYWLPHFLAMMIAAMTAMRVLIVWVYANTRSVLLAQLMHASSSGFLAFFVPPQALSSAQDTLFYVVYAAVLWVVVAIVIARWGKRLAPEPVAPLPV